MGQFFGPPAGPGLPGQGVPSCSNDTVFCSRPWLLLYVFSSVCSLVLSWYSSAYRLCCLCWLLRGGAFVSAGVSPAAVPPYLLKVPLGQSAYCWCSRFCCTVLEPTFSFCCSFFSFFLFVCLLLLLLSLSCFCFYFFVCLWLLGLCHNQRLRMRAVSSAAS